jgi:hypothetical protein
MTCSLFCDFTERGLVFTYRRFGTTYRYHLHYPAWPLTRGQIRSAETSITINPRCVKSQQSEDCKKRIIQCKNFTLIQIQNYWFFASVPDLYAAGSSSRVSAREQVRVLVFVNFTSFNTCWYHRNTPTHNVRTCHLTLHLRTCAATFVFHLQMAEMYQLHNCGAAASLRNANRCQESAALSDFSPQY